MKANVIVNNFSTKELLQQESYERVLQGYKKTLIISLDPALTAIFRSPNPILSAADLIPGLDLVDEYYREETELDTQIYDLYFDMIGEVIYAMLGDPHTDDCELLAAAKNTTLTVFNLVRNSIFKVRQVLLDLEIPSLDMMECIYTFEGNTDATAVYVLRSYWEIKKRGI